MGQQVLGELGAASRGQQVLGVDRLGGAVVNLPKGGTAGVQPSVWLTCWVAQCVVHLLGCYPVRMPGGAAQRMVLAQRVSHGRLSVGAGGG